MATSPAPRAGPAARSAPPADAAVPCRRGSRRSSLAAVAAFVAGAVVGGRGEDPRRTTRASSPTAWTRGDYADDARAADAGGARRVPLERFAESYRRAARVATLSSVTTSRPDEPRDGGASRCRSSCARASSARSRAGRAAGRRESTTARRSTGARTSSTPGLRRGETLTRDDAAAARRDPGARRDRLAEGEARLSELGSLASEIAGRVGPAPPERGRGARAPRRPRGAPSASAGSSASSTSSWPGRPGGELLAGDRVLASVAPQPGPPCARRSTPRSSARRSTALAGRFGGIAVIRPPTARCSR